MKNKKQFQIRRAKRIARHEQKRKAVRKWMRIIGYSPPAKGYKTIRVDGRLVRVKRYRFAMEVYQFVKAQIADKIQRRIQRLFIRK